MKQGCQLSPTLFKLYIDKVLDYITCGGSEGIDILGKATHLRLYPDDITLVSKSHASLQHHLILRWLLLHQLAHKLSSPYQEDKLM